MPGSRRRRISDRLNDLAGEQGAQIVGAQEPNPLSSMGIDREFARGVLRERGGDAILRAIATGLYRTLVKNLHPDRLGEAAAARFKDINSGKERIADADDAALLRWAKEGSQPDADTARRQAERRERVAQRAAALVEQNIRLGRDPRHFSQMVWSQGVLAQREDSTLFIRHQPQGGLQVRRGDLFSLDKARQDAGAVMQTQAFDFQAFLYRFGSFGLEPDSRVTAYIDETGRASLLTPNLDFIMDVTDPVASYRAERELLRDVRERDASDFWLRSKDPLMLTSSVPGPETIGSIKGQVISFPEYIADQGKGGKGRDLAWDLPRMDVGGSIADTTAYRRVRYDRSIGAAAMIGTSGPRSMNYFGIVSLPAAQLVEQEMGYTPIMEPGNSLLLFDDNSRSPVVTDAIIVGMIGNGPQR